MYLKLKLKRYSSNVAVYLFINTASYGLEHTNSYENMLITYALPLPFRFPPRISGEGKLYRLDKSFNDVGVLNICEFSLWGAQSKNPVIYHRGERRVRRVFRQF